MFQGGCRGSFISNALVPSSRLLLWARSILSLKKTSTCPTLSGWQRTIVLRKPKKVGHTDWHLAGGAGGGTAQIHISGRLPSSSLCRPPRCTTLSGHVICLLMKVWGAVERTWALESDTSGPSLTCLGTLHRSYLPSEQSTLHSNVSSHLTLTIALRCRCRFIDEKTEVGSGTGILPEVSQQGSDKEGIQARLGRGQNERIRTVSSTVSPDTFLCHG